MEFIVDDYGISIPEPQFGENISRLVMSKEAFIEAYNKFIRDNTSSDNEEKNNG